MTPPPAVSSGFGLRQRVTRRLLDLLYPRICPWCRIALTAADSSFACRRCAQRVVRIAPPFCLVCGAPVEAGEASRVCAACEKMRPAYDRLRGVVVYDPAVAAAIKSFKYQRDVTLARALARVLHGVSGSGLRWNDYDAIIPVPLHPVRLRERRFNQALLLLRELPDSRSLPIRPDLLQRVRHTTPQAELSAKERRENVKGAFAVTPETSLTDLRVLLVDDVASTGSTLHECAKVCKQAGAAAVDAAVVARAAV